MSGSPSSSAWTTPPRGRRLPAPFSAVLLVLAVATLGQASDAASPAPSPPPPQSAAGGEPAAEERLREGARLVEAAGLFHVTGDRVSFYAHGDRRPLRVLENLALERISVVLSQGGAPREWIVSGTVTEYRGANFLLITRAVLKTRAAPPAPPAAAAEPAP